MGKCIRLFNYLEKSSLLEYTNNIILYHTEDFIILEHGDVWDNDRIKQFMRRKLARADQSKRIHKMDYISIEKYGPSIQMAYHNFICRHCIVIKISFWLYFCFMLLYYWKSTL